MDYAGGAEVLGLIEVCVDPAEQGGQLVAFSRAQRSQQFVVRPSPSVNGRRYGRCELAKGNDGTAVG
ncbi:hypothetical protein [Streptomyces rapamycinicus]|uniref:Uncharacterized protein n=2 Tax=Streptomyces rapamycinicus TaxID=1226757 RepID=A0A0A0NCD0_STRRN|nr:hypothetical protein [Streptomyces rapamycinicus]AGP52095.1 hypothetical protein M271_02305 [Streptomyces rapamycinicus NRRL 5491]MBB4779533.1 hypothetical protein [Streptomyces rapamycinicus]RLV75804.1 hypothetical protein D3C57_141300 [Streptomyces rapamycinicus NRRL 5491]UTP28299.1 hypothetical protein LIV37_02370 [Streptomyces rapamycinicus NRRL 5491]